MKRETNISGWVGLLVAVGSCRGQQQHHGVDRRQTTSRSGHWRPQVHFTPPLNWMNDPNGMFQDSQGTWHLYYQYTDSCSNPVTRDWGHATSPDLYSWVDHPVAITHSAFNGDIWSGSSFVDKNNVSGLFPSSSSGKDQVLAYFTSRTDAKEDQFVAYSLDGGESFTSYAGDPIIDRNRHDFRDPKAVFHKESGKFVLVTTLVNDGLAFYTSTDLVHWTQSSIWTPNPGLAGMECPQLIRLPRRKSATDTTYLGSSWMVMVSSQGGGLGGSSSAVKYIVGDFDGATFTPQGVSTPGSGSGYLAKVFDFGPDVYASAFFHFQSQDAIDGTKDAVGMSWASNLRYATETPSCGTENWRHSMTLARSHWLDENYNLVAVPADTISRQQKGATIIDKKGTQGTKVSYAALATASNPAVDFFLTIHAPSGSGSSAQAWLNLTSSSTGERLGLAFTIAAGALTVQLDRSSMQGFSNDGLNTYSSPGVPIMEGGIYTVHGVLDRSILEVYINGGAQYGTMLYFANGLLDTAELGQVAGSNLSFDFRAVPLRSSWTDPDRASDQSRNPGAPASTPAKPSSGSRRHSAGFRSWF